MSRGLDSLILHVLCPIPLAQLCPEVFPLIFELARRNIDPGTALPGPEFGYIKMVAPFSGFCEHRPQIVVDGNDWLLAGLKSRQLRMMPISLRLLLQNRPRQQALPPKRDQPLGIQVTRMQTP